MTGQATGVNALVRSIGSSLGSQIVATLLAASVTATHPIPTDHAFTQAFWLGAGAALLAAIAASLVPQSRGSAAGDPAEALSPADSGAATAPYGDGTRT
jgi:ABC-type lipoprotein release transport system permease subunit